MAAWWFRDCMNRIEDLIMPFCGRKRDNNIHADYRLGEDVR